ncbi:unnamed protein product [Symbiodinium natans]|uniref:Uncharacterized protein n=1 Tax=Symbiodinium natans TaxID=878477 RepID=A0A812NG75_9DINO|nr:unnamed protein product [Symbiodinium natans]
MSRPSPERARLLAQSSASAELVQNRFDSRQRFLLIAFQRHLLEQLLHGCEPDLPGSNGTGSEKGGSHFNYELVPQERQAEDFETEQGLQRCGLPCDQERPAPGPSRNVLGAHVRGCDRSRSISCDMVEFRSERGFFSLRRLAAWKQISG